MSTELSIFCRFRVIRQLLLAAFLLPGFAGHAPVYAQEDPVLAIINDFELRASDIDALIAGMALGEQVSIRSDLEKFAESLIQEEVLFQYVLKKRLSEEPELREEIKTLAGNHVIEKFVTSKTAVAEAEVQEYYDANTSAIRGETIELSHILKESLAECESIAARISDGESFEDLARQYSIHESSAENGGLLGSVMNHEGPLGFEQKLFEISENEPHIFESEDGCHVMLVKGRNTPPLPKLELVAPAIENLLMREKEIAALQALIEDAHNEIEVIRPEQ